MDLNNPDTIYMGWRYDTIYRTFDAGTTWTPFTVPGGDASEIRGISVASNSSTIYAIHDFRAFRSFNYGATWSTIDIADGPESIYLVRHTNKPKYGSLIDRLSDRTKLMTFEDTRS